MSGPTKFNKRGMFENADIRNRIVKPFLLKIGADPMGQKPLPDMDKVWAAADGTGARWTGQIRGLIAKQGYKTGPWFYKGAKMCLIWPVLDIAFPFAKWIIVRRDPTDIVNSCLKTGFMRAYTNRIGWLGWMIEHENRFREMCGAGLRIMEVWPSKAIIQGDYTELKETIEWLGLAWNEAEVKAFISPELWNEKERPAVAGRG